MGWKFLLTEKKNSLRNVPGVLKTQKKIGGGGGECSWGSETHA